MRIKKKHCSESETRFARNYDYFIIRRLMVQLVKPAEKKTVLKYSLLCLFIFWLTTHVYNVYVIMFENGLKWIIFSHVAEERKHMLSRN